MNIKKKFLFVLLIVNIFVMVISFNHFEARADKLSNIETSANGFINAGKGKATDFDTKTITDEFVGLGQVLTFIGAGVMVAVVSYMGIKYMVSSPDKQAVLKQQLIGVVVAGIVIFGAYGIWKTVISIVDNFD